MVSDVWSLSEWIFQGMSHLAFVDLALVPTLAVANNVILLDSRLKGQLSD